MSRSAMRTLGKVTLLFIFLLVLKPTHAGLSICNQTALPIRLMIAVEQQHEWETSGWHKIAPSECSQVVDGDVPRFIRLYAERSDGVIRLEKSVRILGLMCGRPTEGAFVITSELFATRCPMGEYRYEGERYDFDATSPGQGFILNLKKNDEFIAVETGIVQEKCLASYDDSFQLHSMSLTVTLTNQTWKKRFKKLHHCIKLTVTGPIDIQGIAKAYVDRCVNEGINHNKTQHILQTVGAIVVDVYSGGSTGGSATGAAIGNYVNSVISETLNCLSDSGSMTEYLKGVVTGKFNGTVRHETNWVYWDL